MAGVEVVADRGREGGKGGGGSGEAAGGGRGGWGLRRDGGGLFHNCEPRHSADSSRLHLTAPRPLLDRSSTAWKTYSLERGLFNIFAFWLSAGSVASMSKLRWLLAGRRPQKKYVCASMVADMTGNRRDRQTLRHSRQRGLRLHNFYFVPGHASN